MTRRAVNATMRAFAASVRAAEAVDDEVCVHQENGPEGTEPAVTVYVAGLPLFVFRRDEFLDLVYTGGCDVLEDLERERAS